MAAQTTHPALSRFIVAVALVALGAAAVAVGLARPPEASAFEASGTIGYGYRLCANAAHVHAEVLQGARVLFSDADGDPAGVAVTDALGHFSTKVGNRVVTAEVVLESPGKFKVVPRGTDPYSYQLGEFTRKKPSKSVGFSADGPGGAMNIFNALGVGASVADALAAEAGSVTAVWDPNRVLKQAPDFLRSGSWYTPSKKRLVIDGEGKRLGDEWEPYVVLHEYGHHILHSLHAVGGIVSNKKPHTPTEAYPDAPAQAWSEGFAEAFATLALDSSPDLYGFGPGVSYRGCNKNYDLGASPPYPPPPANNTQYNEAAAASVIWGLTELLGGGEEIVLRQAGIRSLVRIARGFYRPPEDMYDVRAALTTVPGVEESPADHERIDKIFGARGHMAWGKSLMLLPTGVSGGASQLYLRLEGPAGYDGCTVSNGEESFTLQGTGDGPYPGVMLPGILDYTWHDDCLIWSADATIDGTPDAPEVGPSFGQLLLDFPYLAAGAQRTGTFKLYATWLCQDIPPNEDFDGSFCEFSQQHQALVCTPVNPSWFDLCSRTPVGSSEMPVTLQRNGSEKLLLEFTADGRECRLYGDEPVRDCSLGRAWQ